MFGLATLGYVVLVAISAGGLVIWLLGRRRESDKMVGRGFAMFFLGLICMAAWAIMLTNLQRQIIREKINADNTRLLMAREDRLAVYQKRKPDYSRFDMNALEVEKSARRTARLYGWRWETLIPYDQRDKPPAAMAPAQPAGPDTEKPANQ